jgi:hypothetical protein
MANRTLILAAGLIAALTLAACASICNATSACVTKNGGTVTPDELAACNAGCNAETCAKKQTVLDCIGALTCTTLPAWEAAVTACATASGCVAALE